MYIYVYIYIYIFIRFTRIIPAALFDGCDTRHCMRRTCGQIEVDDLACETASGKLPEKTQTSSSDPTVVAVLVVALICCVVLYQTARGAGVPFCYGSQRRQGGGVTGSAAQNHCLVPVFMPTSSDGMVGSENVRRA